MTKIIGLIFRWECDKCGTLTDVKSILSDTSRSILIRPKTKCSCGTARRDYLLSDINKIDYDVKEAKT